MTGVTKMNIRIRRALVAVAFSAVAAAAVTGATIRGETKETSLADVCAKADWPKIPAACIEGGSGAEVRYVDPDMRVTDAMKLRFNSAFN
jgi:hypothetical protein